ncbi:MAG: helix-turn-helix transcriptional regulator [Negativicutes bacterium]
MQAEKPGKGDENPSNRRDPVAAAVRGVRAELKINQASFAALIGVKQPTVAQLEGGRRKPSPRLAYRLAQVSGKPLETFVAAHYGKQTG